MKKTIISLLIIALICSVFINWGLYEYYKYQKAKIARLQIEASCPPTIVEMQRFLGVEDDGIVGPVTIAAWREYSFNQYALKAF